MYLSKGYAGVAGKEKMWVRAHPPEGDERRWAQM